MARKVKRRLGSKWWKTIEITGWAVIAVGLIFLVYSLNLGIRYANRSVGNLFEVLSAGAALFFGAVLTVVARESDSEWMCSCCRKPLRHKEDKACLNCMVLFD
jgi:hypothetical protein